jgi:hypothetical protein
VGVRVWTAGVRVWTGSVRVDCGCECGCVETISMN